MGLPAIRGAILEEIVLHLLEMVGYRVVQPTEEGTRNGHSGLEVQGRGEWHQIDALAAFDHTPAFMYPLRLMVEAKCYANHRPVGIDVVRNAVGVLKDISESYSTFSDRGGEEIQVQRYNYHSAIFSTSGYTRGASRYAVAHQIFLIQYDNVSLLKPIMEGLLGLADRHFSDSVWNDKSITAMSRAQFRIMIKQNVLLYSDFFSLEGLLYLESAILAPLSLIKGSYFGMLQGKWPMHFVSRHPLSAGLFDETDTLRCRIYGKNERRWSFVPLHISEAEPGWFRLEFDLPYQIAILVQESEGDKVEIANIKREHFSFVSLSGVIGGVRRQVKLVLDEDWIQGYLRQARQSQADNQ